MIQLNLQPFFSPQRLEVGLWVLPDSLCWLGPTWNQLVSIKVCWKGVPRGYQAVHIPQKHPEGLGPLCQEHTFFFFYAWMQPGIHSCRYCEDTARMSVDGVGWRLVSEVRKSFRGAGPSAEIWLISMTPTPCFSLLFIYFFGLSSFSCGWSSDFFF